MPLALPSAPFNGRMSRQLLTFDNNLTVSVPQIASVVDTDTGIGIGNGGVNIIINGASKLAVGPTIFQSLIQIQNTNGSAAAPAYSFSSSSSLGMFRRGTDDLGFAVGGTEIVFINDDTLFVATNMNFQLGKAASARVIADSTHTIEVKDSSGTSYYLLATNVAP